MSEQSGFSLDRLCIDFNLAPVMYTQPSWFEEMQHGAFCQELLAAHGGHSAVSSHVLNCRNLTDRYFKSFSRPRARLALLEPEALANVCFYVGVALRAEEFRTILDRNKLEFVRRSIGPEALEFALSRVPFLGAMPEFAFEPEPDMGQRLRLTSIGLAYSVCPVSFVQRPYRDRLALKFPYPLGATWTKELAIQASEPENEALPTVTQKILREFEPQWLPLFD